MTAPHQRTDRFVFRFPARTVLRLPAWAGWLRRTRTVFPLGSSGFSLLELLVVLLVLGLLMGAVAQPLSTVLDQNRHDATSQVFDDVKRAVLGDSRARDTGTFNGFVADMGAVPVVADMVRAQDGAGFWHFYRCIRSHTSTAADHPATGPNGPLYWVEDHRVPFDPADATLDWGSGTDYECTVEPSLLWKAATLVRNDADTVTYRCTRMHRAKGGLNLPPGCAGSPGDPLWKYYWERAATHAAGVLPAISEKHVYAPARRVSGADTVSHDDGAGTPHRYRCIRSHVSALITNEPAVVGSPWRRYWIDEGPALGGEPAWAAGAEYSRETLLDCGWRGPYLAVPPGGVLKDAWANLIVFDVDQANMVSQLDKGRLRIRSLGADGLDDAAHPPVESFDADRETLIEASSWQGILNAQMEINVVNGTGAALSQDTVAVLALHCPVWGRAATVTAAEETLATNGLAPGASAAFTLPAAGPFLFHGVTASGPGSNVTNTGGDAFPLADDPAVGLCSLSVVLVYDDSAGSGSVYQKERLFPLGIGTGGNYAADLAWDVTLP